MKQRNYSSRISLTLLVIISLFSCNKESITDHENINGTVFEYSGTTPIAEVSIQLRETGSLDIIHQVVSDNNGKFEIPVHHLKDGHSYELSAFKQDYTAQSILQGGSIISFIDPQASEEILIRMIPPAWLDLHLELKDSLLFDKLICMSSKQTLRLAHEDITTQSYELLAMANVPDTLFCACIQFDGYDFDQVIRLDTLPLLLEAHEKRPLTLSF